MENNIYYTLSEMSEILGKTKSTIHEHIQKVYQEKELDKRSTIFKKRLTREEGSKIVTRDMDVYSIDILMALLYRIKSKKAKEFRIWATSVLRDHYVKALKLRK